MIPTQITTLDQALGGGVPRGALTHLISESTSGANTIALRVIAGAHLAGELAVYGDLGGTFDTDYALRCGVSLREVLLAQPNPADALEVALTLAQSGGAGALILDGTICPPGGQSSEYRALARLLPRSGLAVVLLTGPVYPPALGEMAAVRIKLERERWLKRRNDVRGCRIQANILKNRFAPSRGVIRFSVDFGDWG